MEGASEEQLWTDLAGDIVDGCIRFNFESWGGVVAFAVDGDILAEAPLKAEVLIERAANDGREIDVFKSWRALIVRDFGSLLTKRGVGGSKRENPPDAGGIFSSCSATIGTDKGAVVDAILKDGFGMDEVEDRRLLRSFFEDVGSGPALMVGLAAMSKLSTVGLLCKCPSLSKPLEMHLKFCARKRLWLSRVEPELSVSQSLMASTMTSLSLRIRSAPLEFLTGPMGAEMRGRLLFPRPRILLNFVATITKDDVPDVVERLRCKGDYWCELWSREH